MKGNVQVDLTVDVGVASMVVRMGLYLAQLMAGMMVTNKAVK
jgi:hypothetical protein